MVILVLALTQLLWGLIAMRMAKTTEQSALGFGVLLAGFTTALAAGVEGFIR